MKSVSRKMDSSERDSAINGGSRVEVIPVDTQGRIEFFEKCMRQKINSVWLSQYIFDVMVSRIPEKIGEDDVVRISMKFSPEHCVIQPMLDKISDQLPVKLLNSDISSHELKMATVFLETKEALDASVRLFDIPISLEALDKVYNKEAFHDFLLTQLLRGLSFLDKKGERQIKLKVAKPKKRP